MIFFYPLSDAYKAWFNKFHSSNLSPANRQLADIILNAVGKGDNKSAQLLDLQNATILGTTRVGTFETIREDAEVSAICAIYHHGDILSNHATRCQLAWEDLIRILCTDPGGRTILENIGATKAKPRLKLSLQDRSVLLWMLGSVDIESGNHNIRGLCSLKQGLEGFKEISSRKKLITTRGREIWDDAAQKARQDLYLDWYEKQIKIMHKVLAGVMQFVLDWMELDTRGHLRPATKSLVEELRKKLEHSATADGKTCVCDVWLPGDTAEVAKVIRKLLNLAFEISRRTHRDVPFSPGNLGSEFYEFPEIITICAWGCYEINEIDSSILLLRQTLEWFSDVNWMQAVARWMLGLILQEYGMTGAQARGRVEQKQENHSSEPERPSIGSLIEPVIIGASGNQDSNDGLAEWVRALEQMEEFTWRANRRNGVELQKHFEGIISIMRAALDS